MYQTMPYLNDEHMQLYEWSGAGAGITLAGVAKKSQRSPGWLASYGVLMLLAALLVLNGCDNTGPAEQASEQVDQAVKEMQEAQARPSINVGTVEEYTPALDPVHKREGGTLFQSGSGMPRR